MSAADETERSIGLLLNTLSGGVVGEVVNSGETLLNLFGVKSSDERVADALKHEWEDVVESTVIRVRQNEEWLEELKKRGIRGAEIAAILDSARRVFDKTADPKKLEILKNAMVNAFDPNIYEEGLTRRILQTLEDLEYGDIYLLKRSAESTVDVAVYRRSEYEIDMSEPGINQHHARMLVVAGVAGLQTRGATTKRLVPNTFGERVLQLVADPPGPPEESDI